MKRFVLALALLPFIGGCGTSDDVHLLIRGVVPPDASCVLPANPTAFRSSGAFDPANADSFVLTPNVSNRLQSTEDSSPQASVTDPSLLAEANVVTLRGFDVCYALAVEFSGFDTFGDGAPDCKDFANREFVLATGTMEPNLGSQSTSVSVFGPAAQRALFGDAWAPRDIALIGDEGNGYYNFNIEPPSAGAAEWGDFPDEGVVDVAIIFRAVGTRGNGATVRSDFHVHTLTVIPGAVNSACGSRALICSNGALRGSFIDPSASCIPASNLDQISCEDIDPCPDEELP